MLVRTVSFDLKVSLNSSSGETYFWESNNKD